MYKDCSIIISDEQAGQLVDYIFGNFLLVLQRIGNKPLPVDYGNLVGVHAKARPFVVQRVQYDEVKVLAVQLVLRVLYLVIGFECESDQYLAAFLLFSQSGGNVPGRFQTEHQVILFPFDLDFGCRFGRKVCNCGAQDSRIGIRISLCSFFVHLCGILHIYPPYIRMMRLQTHGGR